MKKQFLLLTLVLAFVANLANAQDTTIAVFDDGVLDWGTWGAPIDIIANPNMVHNNTDSCALLDQTEAAWSGISLTDWSGVTTVLDSSMVAVYVDAYFVNTGGTLKLHADNSLSGQADIEMYVDLPADEWTQVIFDLSGLDTIDYQQMAFQSSVQDSLLIDNVRFLKAVPEDPTNLFTGGGMENEAAWNFYFGTNGVNNVGTHYFNYIADTAKNGEGGSYYVSGSQQTATMLWQPVTLKPNRYYSFSGAFKNVSEDSISEAWMEILLKKTMPDGGEVTSAGADEFGIMLNTWDHGEDVFNVDTVYEREFLLPADAPDQWYAVIKAGTWPSGSYFPTWEYIFDEFRLEETGVNTVLEVDQLIDGEITDDTDYDCSVDITWDADSVYLMINVVDDTIYLGSGDAYVNDNIEIYFDMDNSKTAFWPRGGSTWPPPYDENDYQFRVLPDSTWEAFNSKGGVNYAYDATSDTSYSFMVNIAWDSLMMDFDPAVGTLIGFDILASDNDGDGRNQVTWNSVSTSVWSDQSFFGTLALDTDNSFLPIFDTEAPSAPVVTATVNENGSVKLEWDAVTDNIVVYYYTILMDNAEMAEKFGTTADGTETWTSAVLENGTYAFKVRATDNSGNTSVSAEVEAVVDIEIPVITVEEQPFTVYPNPSEGLVYIKSDISSVNLAVYAISGELIAVHNFNSDYTLDMTSMNPGLYILKLESEGTVQLTRLIIK